MGEAALMDVLKESLWLTVIVSAPVLVVALLAGLVIGLFQALTSVQEMTLTFVPKLALIVVVFWASMDFAGTMLVNFYQRSVIERIEAS
jgi:flagellar biosynthetic protein FliQ